MSEPIDFGVQYDPLSDTWVEMSRTNAPSPRYFHSAVWTGSKMIVWGGTNETGPLNTGGLYDPATDTWTAMSTTGAPGPAFMSAAVWDGSRMFVWGYPGGGRYDPASDTWSPASEVNAPPHANWQTAVWTGTEVIVWGGHRPDYGVVYDVGARYDPVQDLWRPIVRQIGAQ